MPVLPDNPPLKTEEEHRQIVRDVMERRAPEQDDIDAHHSEERRAGLDKSPRARLSEVQQMDAARFAAGWGACGNLGDIL